VSTPEQGTDGPQTGENTCPACAGTGRVDGQDCAACTGTGTVVEQVGDA
jgi:DnaJ-class molecular chaperone